MGIVSIILLFLLLLVVVLVTMPGDLTLGNIHGSLSLQDTQKPFVFWFSHCFDPAIYIHSVIIAAETVQKYRPGTTLYVCSAVLPERVTNLYINFQLRAWKGIDKVKVKLIKRPFRVPDKVLRGDSVVVLHPSDNLRIFADYKSPQVIRSMFGNVNRSSPFHPHLNPFRRVPDKAQIVICSLTPTRSYEGPCLLPLGFNPDTGFTADLLKFILRAHFTDYRLSYSLPKRHGELIDYDLVEMLVNSVGGMQQLGICSIEKGTSMFV